ncbi:hypothetical protein BH18ACT11_BH18ACT11_20140 [soil metagenome]
MIGNTAVKPRVKMTALFAYAAGVSGILGNLCLIALYVLLGLQSGSPVGGTLLGSAFHVSGTASDLLGSLGAAFMIPVAFLLGGRLPRRKAARLTQAAGLAAMALLTAAGPLLVLRLLAFEIATLISIAGLMILGLWLLLNNRWLRLTDDLPSRLARFGELVGAGFLAGEAIFGLGLLLPWMSWPQLVVFGVGVVVGLPAYLGIPVWFVFLGRYLGASAE